MIARNQRILGASLLLIGLALSVYFYLPVEFSRDPGIWFTPGYYTQFIPLYISVALALSGLFCLFDFRGTNFHLAVFGHTASEEILFDWFGWTQSSLPLFANIVFLPLSLGCLWLAYFNILKKRKLSILEAIFGLAVSTAAILIPRYL